MANRNYERGVRFEREVIDIFRKAGYDVIRAAGSHSPFDFVAIRTTEAGNEKKVYFVAGQCKVRKV